MTVGSTVCERATSRPSEPLSGIGEDVFEPDFALQRRHAIGVGRLAIASTRNVKSVIGSRTAGLRNVPARRKSGVERAVEQARDRGGQLQLLAAAEEVAVAPVDLGAEPFGVGVGDAGADHPRLALADGDGDRDGSVRIERVGRGRPRTLAKTPRSRRRLVGPLDHLRRIEPAIDAGAARDEIGIDGFGTADGDPAEIRLRTGTNGQRHVERVRAVVGDRVALAG